MTRLHPLRRSPLAVTETAREWIDCESGETREAGERVANLGAAATLAPVTIEKLLQPFDHIRVPAPHVDALVWI
jgi:hypothetical protein